MGFVLTDIKWRGARVSQGLQKTFMRASPGLKRCRLLADRAWAKPSCLSNRPIRYIYHLRPSFMPLVVVDWERSAYSYGQLNSASSKPAMFFKDVGLISHWAAAEILNLFYEKQLRTSADGSDLMLWDILLWLVLMKWFILMWIWIWYAFNWYTELLSWRLQCLCVCACACA